MNQRRTGQKATLRLWYSEKLKEKKRIGVFGRRRMIKDIKNYELCV